MTNRPTVWKTMPKRSPLKNDFLLIFHDNYPTSINRNWIRSRIRNDIIILISDEATEFLKIRPQQLTGTVYIFDISPGGASSVLRNYDTGEYIEGPWLDLLEMKELSKEGHGSLAGSASKCKPALEDYITVTEDGIVISGDLDVKGNLDVTGFVKGKICYSNIE